jgi:putative addiction module component (TIGR02574 family)
MRGLSATGILIPMATPPDRDLLSDALSLPAGERARIAHELILSLDEGEDPDAADAWVEEIERRAREIDSGAVATEDWSTVRARWAARWRKP